MKRVMTIYCCGCERGVAARLTDGAEVYPHRPDLRQKPFWRCDACGNYVGCHHKTRQPKKPLGCIPTPELRSARGRLHTVLDRLWRHEGYDRKELYQEISRRLGREFHVGETRSMEEISQVHRILSEITEGASKEL